jgi:acetoacetyl-CoA synthetase
MLIHVLHEHRMPALIDTSKSSPFVTMKIGSHPLPILIMHGLCGRILFSKLARHIRTTNPVYGIQARGIDAQEQPFSSIEDMSRFYLEALSRYHPHGPYILIGYSFGGLVALEMAQRLLQHGMCVPLLVLVDAYPHPGFLTEGQRRRLLVRRLRSHLGKMWQLPLPDAIAYFVRGFSNRLKLSSSSYENLAEAQDGRGPALELVKSKAYEALANYKPRFYPGKINFVTTKEKSFFPEDPEPIWAHLADKLEVDIIPGNHLNMVTTEFEALAAVITRHIRELDC